MLVRKYDSYNLKNLDITTSLQLKLNTYAMKVTGSRSFALLCDKRIAVCVGSDSKSTEHPEDLMALCNVL